MRYIYLRQPSPKLELAAGKPPQNRQAAPRLDAPKIPVIASEAKQSPEPGTHPPLERAAVSWSPPSFRKPRSGYPGSPLPSGSTASGEPHPWETLSPHFAPAGMTRKGWPGGLRRRVGAPPNEKSRTRCRARLNSTSRLQVYEAVRPCPPAPSHRAPARSGTVPPGPVRPPAESGGSPLRVLRPSP